MIVVSDTSPLNYLVLVDQIDALPALFDRVVAPPAVVQELRHTLAPPRVQSWAAAPPAWLEIIAPATDLGPLPRGAGEGAAIALAQELQATAILLDDRQAHATAKRAGLRVIGTLAVLDLGAERGLVDLPKVINALRQTSFRGPQELMDEMLRRDALRRSKNP